MAPPDSRGKTNEVGQASRDLLSEKSFLADTSPLFEALLANSLDLIYFKDRQSRFVRYSRSFAQRIPSADPDALIGKTDFDCYAEEHARPAYEDEQEIIRTGKPLIGKLEEETHPDGRVTWVLTTKMPWRDKDGNIIGTFGISKEVTALKEAEAKLTKTGNLLETLLRNSPDCIYFKDRQSRFVHFSRAFEKLFNVSDTNSLPGKTDFDFFTEDHARPAFEDEQEIIRTGKPLIGKLEQETHSDGRVTWCLTTKMPWRDKDGNIIGTFGISKDVTAMKEAEAKLEQVHKQLMETSRQAGMAEVAISVLHNVGNVLNSINVSVGVISDLMKNSKIGRVVKVAALMREHASDLADFMTKDEKGRQLPVFVEQLAVHLAEEQSRVLNEVSSLTKNVEHVKGIVTMQQSYARVSGVLETIKVTDLVEDALRTNAGVFVSHGVELIREYEEPLPEILVDKHKALQILVNLIRNATQACEETSRPDKRLTMRIHTERERVRVTVLDNGAGIKPENITRIFNHGFTTRKDGHGFGLHNGALIAKELGGLLSVRSDGEGKGAAFTLELPCNPKPTRG
jgi:PAS domain S-box-containing protein